MLGHGGDQRAGVGHGGDHLMAAIGDQPGQALPEQGSVLGDHHAQRPWPGHWDTIPLMGTAAIMGAAGAGR